MTAAQHVERLLYTPEEAAKALAISRALVYDLVNRGEIRSLKIGASRRITPTALDEYIRRLSEEQGPDAA